MELQAGAKALAEAGIALYALSYDEREALADFARAYEIEFPLLSDPDSRVIREFGILNTLIDPNDHPWYGIPFPGTYVTDADGVITHKFFESNLALRVGPEPILRAARGETMTAPAAVDPVEVEVEVFLDGGSLAAGLIRELVARFRVPPGRHLYAAPAPQGMLAADLALDDQDGVITRPLLAPEPHVHRLEGTGERFRVYDGEVELRLPVTVNSRLLGAGLTETGGEGRQFVRLCGTVSWQACDAAACDVPRSKRFEIEVPIAEFVAADFMASPSARVRPMNGAAHFRRMFERRGRPPPG